MSDSGMGPDVAIPAVVVFLTLGAAILAFVAGDGLEPAALILALGWLVALPLSAVLTQAFGLPVLGSGGDEQSESASEEPVEADGALDALRRRYARGDIDEAEFERRVERLLETEDEEEARRALLDDPAPERETEREL